MTADCKRFGCLLGVVLPAALVKQSSELPRRVTGNCVPDA